ncbi:hypothetical protein GCG54_00010936 [Colletotrichum gloeosporioides]|uniref:Siderophore biosynthesis enzyme n=2 Tax=Colletotrichum gloeosporioides TaxID=474922 RepID=T0JX10_COLGC|nr:uncharacterized protein GCG54_00010936 [Colletotrichum gloeosporioides]EQB43989.1 hypothetical protein CGLO_17322 [Colletotrichum gloeosporioides Cg-14]KAF3808746.1 hypothetical protein GCG54_00010936 [Colletotrichum gloeosporioides]
MSFRYLATMAILASTALAKTDLTGCTSSDSVVTPSGGGTPYATRVYYVPDTGEICAALDCGGGRAPPKTTVPGCPSYEGTETYSPSFLPLKTTSAVVAQSTQATVTTMTPKGDSTASASGSASVTAAADSSSMSGSKSDDVQVQTDTLLTVTSSTAATTAAPGNGTIATTGRSGSRTTGTGAGASGSPTSVPNGAAAGVSNMFGLMAGVALGAAALL